MNLKNADLTSPGQKAIAAAAGVGVLGLLYFALPPLVVILTNLWLAVGLAVPLVFLAYNYEMVWSVFKQLSWEATKKLISSNPLWHMWQGHKWLLARNEEVGNSIVEIGAIKGRSEDKLTTVLKNLEMAKKEGLKLEQMGAPESQRRVVEARVSLYDQEAKSLQPRLEQIELQHQHLIELHDHWVADAEILKLTLEAKESEYELAKEMSRASNSAMAFLSRDSQAMINFKESVKQIERQTSQYMSNVANFQRTVLPTLQSMDARREMNQDEGRRLIEEFKQQQRLQLT